MKQTLFYLLIILLIIGCSKTNEQNISSPLYDEGLNDGINLGIAANYSEDKDIIGDKYVLAAENFESGKVEIYTEEDRYKNNVEVTSEEFFLGNYGTKHSWPEGYNGLTCRFPIPDKAHESGTNAYFVRMYLNFDDSFHPGDGMEPVGVKGFGIYNESGESGANIPCNGENWYCASCQFVGWGPSAKEMANDKYLWFGHMYSYNPYPDKASAITGSIHVSDPATGNSPYRFYIYSEPYQYIKFNTWHCYEIGLYLNTPGKFDGEIRYWYDGVLQSRALNMRFRDIENLKPEYVHLNLYRTTTNFPQTMIRYADNIVIATRYIGPAVQ